MICGKINGTMDLKMQYLGVLLLFLFALRCVGGESDPLRGVLCGKGDRLPEGYVPPILSNGEISLALDWTCGMDPSTNYYRLEPGVYLAGRRHSAPRWGLFDFGKINTRVVIDGRASPFPCEWTQTLDIAHGLQHFSHSHPGGVVVETDAFVMYGRNAVVFRRRLRNGDTREHAVKVSTVVDVPTRNARQMQGSWRLLGEGKRRRAQFDYECLVDWPFESQGCETLWGVSSLGSCDYAATNRQGTVSATFTLAPGESGTVDVLFGIENWGGIVSWQQMRRPVAVDTIAEVLAAGGAAGFDALQHEHEKGWRDYFAEGYVRIPDARLQRMVDVANYHVRCDRTPWSFPVGIFPSHWNGRYFGFDEMYIHQGMISAGHIADAQKCPDFRFKTLPEAEKRVGHYGRNRGRDGAQWMWESVETGDTEGCPVGFWQQHYFHMSTICRTAWTQYLYSDDLGWLREKGYPVITGCARFFSKNMIYRNSDGTIYLGKCTDLERLGPSRENAYMTTVGAMYAMRVFADASEVLSTNLTEAAEMRRLAEGLKRSLPVDGDRYVGYKGCKEETVATLAGGFPFPVFGRKDRMHVETCRHFITKGTESGGNMYPVGNHVCPWYAGKMALSMIWLGDDVEPYRWLKDAASSIGHFGESFEINEPGLHRTPWFATASGTLLFAVNQMLLCDAENELWLGMGVPKDWKDYSFKLPAYGGLTVRAEVRSGKLSSLSISTRRDKTDPVLVRVRMRKAVFNPRALSGVTVRECAEEGDEVSVLLEIKFRRGRR